jgi:hypothetical protein
LRVSFQLRSLFILLLEVEIQALYAMPTFWLARNRVLRSPITIDVKKSKKSSLPCPWKTWAEQRLLASQSGG